MKRRVVLAVLVALVAVFVTSHMAVSEAEQAKVAICHMPGHSPTTFTPITIMVSVSAAEAHGAHGDTFGPCD